MELILTTLKYFGLALAFISSVSGILTDFKKDGKVTRYGRMAIILTLLGFAISASSTYIQNSIDKQSILSRIEADNKKNNEEQERFRKQMLELTRLNKSQIDLIRKQDIIQRKNDSLALLDNNNLIKRQMEDRNYLLKQMLISNYMQSVPQSIELVIEFVGNDYYPTEFKSLDSMDINMSWNDISGKEYSISGGYTFGGYVHRMEEYGCIHTNSIISNDDYIDSTQTTINGLDYSYVTCFASRLYDSKNEGIAFNLSGWINDTTTGLLSTRVIDIYNYDFDISLGEYDSGLIEYDMDGIAKFYLRLDHKYCLPLPQRFPYGDFYNDRKNKCWNAFREDIYNKILQISDY